MKAVLVLLALIFVASAQQYCSPCEGLIGMIESYITENTTEAQILQALENVCNLIPGSIGQECAQLVAQNGPEIIQDIINQEPPNVVCTQLGLCTSKKEKVVSSQVNLKHLREIRQKAKAMKAQKKKAPLDNCPICQTVIAYVSAWVASNQTETYIENKINQYCPLLGLPVAKCQEIADQVPSVIQQIENGATPQVVCQTLGLCSSKANPRLDIHRKKVQANLAKAKTKGADCSICVFAVGQIEDYIASNATETEIMNALNQACALLGSFQAQCNAIVQNVPAYIAQLEKAEDPTTICTQVGICTSAPKTHFRVHRKKN
jgi:saposin